ncbi:MAG: type II toxin-antitoxin system HicB family antitoxin [Tissierellaceae bacterium]
MYKDIYIFPAIITKFADNDYNVSFLDFEEIITFGETLEEAYTMAEDALKLTLFDLYEDEKDIIEATDIGNIELDEHQIIILVKINLNQIIKEYDNKAVKKTLTIPAWLNKEAEKSHVNYSQLLQEALVNHLKLHQ